MLFVTGGDITADSGTPYVFELAANIGSAVVILIVCENPSINECIGSSPKILSGIESVIETGRRLNMDVSCEIKKGSPADAIMENIGHSGDITMVVLGSGLKRKSVLDAGVKLRNLSIPVVAVSDMHTAKTRQYDRRTA